MDTQNLPSLEELTNQTQFSAEEPLFEKVSSPIEETPEEQAARLKVEKQRKRMLFFIIATCVVLFFMVGSLVLLMPKHMLPRIITQASPSPTVQTQQTDYDLALNSVDDALKAGDPTKVDMPFPPIDLSLTLDKTQQ